jgi:F0F1-type ATP synthase beta subunit
MKDIGKVVQMIGAVFYAEFDETNIPDIYNALIIDIDRNGQKESVVLQVQQ